MYNPAENHFTAKGLAKDKEYSMVSGGADASVHLWDLETRGSESSYLYKSIASVTK